MKLLIDMNLSPRWVEALAREGWEAVHWSTVGSADARDREIMRWAVDDGCVVSTQDLAFGAILANTRAVGPSVIQVREQDILPDTMGQTVFSALREHEAVLEQGALIVLDQAHCRARILPLRL